jgi:putative ubiquitin-RnfH superfamily antitoxin RatB of RatAB toxin-antitoxin module
MAIHYKILGQVVPSAANTWTQLYPCPTGKEAVCSSLTVANLTADDILYRVRIRQANASADNKQYVVYDTAVAGGVSQALQLSMTLSADDRVEVYAPSTSVAFNLFGSEIDA